MNSQEAKQTKTGCQTTSADKDAMIRTNDGKRNCDACVHLLTGPKRIEFHWRPRVVGLVNDHNVVIDFLKKVLFSGGKCPIKSLVYNRKVTKYNRQT